MADDAETHRDTTVYLEPLTRRFTTWSPQMLTSAELQADSGNLRFASDLCEWLLSDEEIKAVFDTRFDSLLGLDLNFEEGRGRKKKAAKRGLEADEDFYSCFPESELKRLATWGAILGVAPAQNVWQQDEVTKRQIPVLENKNPRWLRFDWASRRWLLMVAQATGGAWQEIEITPGDGTWILHTPYGGTRPWAWGLWRGLGAWKLLKSYAQTDWATAGQNARGVRVGFSAGDKDPTGKDQRAQLAGLISTLGSNASIVLPHGFDLKLVQLAADTKGIYDAQIEMANAAFAIAVLGQEGTTHSTPGLGQGGNKSQDKTQLARTRSDGKHLAATLHDQSLVHWAEINYGDRQLAPWPEYDTDPPEDLKTKADTLNTLADGLTKLDALGIDIEPVLEEYELERLPPEERTPPPPVAPPPGAPVDPNVPPSGDAAPDQTPGGTPPPPPAGTDPKASPKADAAPAKAKKAKAVTLASGASPSSKRGFVQGQLYADRVVASARDAAADALADDLDVVLHAIDRAESPEETRRLLKKAYAQMHPGKLAQVVASATITTQLAGRAAVQEDAGR